MSGGKGFIGLFGVGLVMGWQLMRAAGGRARKHEEGEIERLSGLLPDIGALIKAGEELNALHIICAEDPSRKGELLFKLKEVRTLLKGVGAKAGSSGGIRSEAEDFCEQIEVVIRDVERSIKLEEELGALTRNHSKGSMETTSKNKRSKVVQIARVPEEV
jgi:hypothetical protein